MAANENQFLGNPTASSWMATEPGVREILRIPHGPYHVLIIEMFSLPDDADTGRIAKNITSGLESAISRFPVLPGALEKDTVSGRMWVVKKRDSSVGLHIKHMPISAEFPGYGELAEKDVR
jgi:hypothetical protein